MKEQSIQDLLDDVKRMVRNGLLIQDYEVTENSYVCFIVKQSKGNYMYHSGRMANYSPAVQSILMGLYLNESIGDHKVTGIYKISGLE